MGNKLKTNVVVIGAGGFGREVIWTIQEHNKIYDEFSVVGFLDDDESLWGKMVDGIKVLGNIDWVFLQKKEIKYIIAIADSQIRKKIVEKLGREKISFQTIIHPNVVYSKSSKIGNGVIIQAGGIITINVKIGNHVHVNMGTTIAHDSVIQDFVTMAPGVHVNGETVIEEGVFIGSGAVLQQKLKIGKWAKIGAGTVLRTNAEEHSTYVGIPGKLKIK